MTSPGRDLPRDLAARLFRALYTDYDLHTIGDIHVAVPKGATCYTGRILSEIARQVSDHHDDQHPPIVNPGSRIIATGRAYSGGHGLRFRHPEEATPRAASRSVPLWEVT